jgi:hypothetical protein
MSVSTHELNIFFSTKALLQDVELMLKPLQEDDLEGRAQLADKEVAAMDLADEALVYLNDAIEKHSGTEKFARAMEIAYAPIPDELIGGLKRVSEYYRRAEVIETL